MTVRSASKVRTSTANGGGVNIEKLRSLIAKHLDVEISRVTDDADLSRDLGADWLDRLELIILAEEIAGVEIADYKANGIKVVGDLIAHADVGKAKAVEIFRGNVASTLAPSAESRPDSDGRT